MNNDLYQLLLSLKIGDGCYVTHRKTLPKTYYVQTNSIKLDYLNYKEKILNDYGIKTHRFQSVSGYKKGSIIWGFKTLITPEISEVGRMKKIDVINSLDMQGLIYYYLDDGSYHIHRHSMHLYCNSFTQDEVNALINKLYEFFSQKKCIMHFDKKKDGRQFPYLYVPIPVVKEFSKYVRDFLVKNGINSMLYKTIPPSQTIESIK